MLPTGGVTATNKFYHPTLIDLLPIDINYNPFSLALFIFFLLTLQVLSSTIDNDGWLLDHAEHSKLGSDWAIDYSHMPEIFACI